MRKTKSGILINWTPIFDIDESGYYAGVDENGKWYSDTAEGLKALEEGGVLGILPILEMNRNDFSNYLDKKIAESGLTSDCEIDELETEVINVSFSISTYWAELGINWLKESEIDSEFKKRLNWLIENKKYSQKFRHQAFSKIKRSERLKKTSNTNIIAKSLNPLQKLDGKNNYQEFILVEKNGNTKTRIILFIPNVEIREQVICNQFLSRYVQFFLEETVGVNIISRDKPWDFELQLSNSEKLIIEITSIADEVDLFKTFKYQERITDKSNYENIEFHELIKLNDLFPDTKIEDLIILYKKQKIKKDELVPNPNYGKEFIFQSSISDDLKSFDELIKTAIDKKVNKNHPNKENVTLIIDNRTVTYELDNILEYLNSLGDYFTYLPFKEVWLYTGYYSDLDGSNAEYSLVPLKITEEKLEKLTNKMKE